MRVQDVRLSYAGEELLADAVRDDRDLFGAVVGGVDVDAERADLLRSVRMQVWDNPDQRRGLIGVLSGERRVGRRRA
jgi:hypothetical protein